MANRTEEFVGDLFERCSRVMLTMQALPQPVDRARPRHRHRRGLPGRRRLRPGRRVDAMRGSRRPGSISVCSARRPACPCRATSRASARSRCCSPASSSTPRRRSTGGSSTASCRLPSSTPSSRRLIGLILEKPRAVCAAGKALFYEQLEARLPQAYAAASQRDHAATCWATTPPRASARSSRSASRAGTPDATGSARAQRPTARQR